MTPAWITVFLDVPRPVWSQAQRFWSAVTSYDVSPARGEHDQFLSLLPPGGTPWLKLQAVEEPEARLHLDLAAADPLATVERALALGAVPAWRYDDVEVLRSPGGLPFCVTTAAPDGSRLDRASDAVLDQACLDIPARLWATETDFWAGLTGRPLRHGRRAEFDYLADPDGAAVRLLLQRLDDDAAGVTAHADLAVADRAAEAARHERLGATRLADLEWWTVLRAPSGHRYCLTDRDPRTGTAATP